MAKRREKDSRLVWDVILIILSAVTLISLFVGVIHSTQSLVGTTELWSATGIDLIKSTFASELKGLEGGAAAIYTLKTIEENAFVIGVFQWGYIVSVVAAAACLVFCVLDLLHIRLTLLNKLCSIALLLGSLATIIFGFIATGKIVIGTGSIMVGIFLLIAGIAYAILYFVKERE